MRTVDKGGRLKASSVGTAIAKLAKRLVGIDVPHLAQGPVLIDSIVWSLRLP